MSDASPKIWLITGCSSGFGRILAELVLARGDRALMTIRDREAVSDLLDKYPETSRAFILDVSHTDRVPAVVQEAESSFGRIDILVNNAGYTLFGGVEEATVAQYRHVFETNFFGAVEAMRAVLPGMRKRRQGRIINVSSMAGISGGLGMPYYAATKFALTAVSESLALEATHLNIRVTLVEPGPFRTAARKNWKMSEPIADYAPSIGVARETLKAGHGREPGNPELGARAIIKIADAPDPPLHLPLGRDALARFETKFSSVTRDIETWRDLVLSTDD